jgi:hypothetical protein
MELVIPMRLLACVCLLVGAVGCGPAAPPPVELHPVSGTVKVNGEPAAAVTVTFISSSAGGPAGAAASGNTNAAGEFKLSTPDGRDGAPAGQYRVLFTKLLKPDGTPVGPDELAADVGFENVLPDVYNSPTDTPVGTEVPAGPFDFDLKAR